jgi:DNA recombination protein RmuC
MNTWVVIGIVLGSIVALSLILVGAFFVFGQHLVVKLMERSETARKGSKDEIESGVKSMLETNQQALDRLVGGLEKQLKDNRNEVVGLKNQNAAIREQLLNTAKITEGLQVSTEGLKNLLTNNRLRGEWGEQVAEDLLLAAGFVEKVNYLKQTSSGEGRPDFTILLPDGSKLNVDAKFPFDDLVAYQRAKTPEDKRKALNNFRTSVKNKVREVTSKDYINPENQTLDFVIMFVPNEMIFSFIYEKLPDINEYCNKHRVILAGPFGFTAVLRLVLQAYKNFRYQKDLQQILGLISKFQTEYVKFGESMEKLGRQIDTTQKTYVEVEGTRNRQLTRVMDLIGEHSEQDKMALGKKENDR